MGVVNEGRLEVEVELGVLGEEIGGVFLFDVEVGVLIVVGFEILFVFCIRLNNC